MTRASLRVLHRPASAAEVAALQRALRVTDAKVDRLVMSVESQMSELRELLLQTRAAQLPKL